ncbi:radical SAM protein [Psychromarinibacter sp. C21-152]|uniref:Radical SAM protein n=1 Tax=Psychromarinibacter sediminicola TaxID=3033385 RepID=A0AAE3NV58_9RHOB|nr:radical SAM protein [Psychromarinibacter sediminicola]MDF0602697.1 radical SAM protein [Psychromarinibacter sediminicola]
MFDEPPRALLRTEWVIKVSKLCNLRCRYCYEWNELDDPRRMSFELWERVLTAIRDHMVLSVSRGHADVARAEIIWHGGEPLLLPQSYYERVMEMQRRIFPREFLDDQLIGNQIQTNLYSVGQDRLDYLLDEAFGIGVSYDGVPGVRLTAGGKEAEDRVLANLRAFAEQGMPLGVITVLAGHTAPRLVELYEDIKPFAREWRLLSLFNGPAERPMQGIDISPAEITDALGRLFAHWFEDGCVMPIRPLKQALTTVIMQRLGLETPCYDRTKGGDSVLVVDPDGRLFLPNQKQDQSLVLGDLSRESIAEALESAAYAASLRAEATAQARICGSCRYFGACSGYPIFASDDGGVASGTCRTFQPLLLWVDAYLNDLGVTDAELRSLFLDSAELASDAA